MTTLSRKTLLKPELLPCQEHLEDILEQNDSASTCPNLSRALLNSWVVDHAEIGLA